MERYASLIGVVVEKLGETYKDLKFNLNGLEGILGEHGEEERTSIPELITIRELRDAYAEMIRCLEDRFPGIKDM